MAGLNGSREQRDRIRARLFENRRLRRKIVTIFDVEVELRQPVISQILKDREEGKTDSMDGLLDMLMTYCYVPGTDEPIFEKGDLEALKMWPADDWIKTFTNTVNELTAVDVPAAVKN